MSVAATCAVTTDVVTGNVTLVAPAGIDTLAPTVAIVELLFRATTAPPAGAAPVSVTVPVAPVPPATLVGATVTMLRLAAAVTAHPDSVATTVVLPSLTVTLHVLDR